MRIVVGICLVGLFVCSPWAVGVEWDDTRNKNWPEGFNPVSITSSGDGSPQPAVYRPSSSKKPMPLIVSLHTWSGNYTQKDDLAPFIDTEDWHYIHPDFRGPNKSPQGCMSDLVIPDIDDSIAYAIKHGNVDLDNIFVVGASGGGYATLGSFVRLNHQVNTFLSWVPLSDVEAWYWQCKHRGLKYADDILKSTSTGAQLNTAEAKKRSPLFWKLPNTPNGRLEIYAGIRDGYEGSIPTSHSILFYNKVANVYGDASQLVSTQESIDIVSKGVPFKATPTKLHENDIFFYRETGPVSLTIFDGKHEMLAEACVERIKERIRP